MRCYSPVSSNLSASTAARLTTVPRRNHHSSLDGTDGKRNGESRVGPLHVSGERDGGMRLMEAMSQRGRDKTAAVTSDEKILSYAKNADEREFHKRGRTFGQSVSDHTSNLDEGLVALPQERDESTGIKEKLRRAVDREGKARTDLETVQGGTTTLTRSRDDLLQVSLSRREARSGIAPQEYLLETLPNPRDAGLERHRMLPTSLSHVDDDDFDNTASRADDARKVEKDVTAFERKQSLEPRQSSAHGRDTWGSERKGEVGREGQGTGRPGGRGAEGFGMRRLDGSNVGGDSLFSTDELYEEGGLCGVLVEIPSSPICKSLYLLDSPYTCHEVGGRS